MIPARRSHDPAFKAESVDDREHDLGVGLGIEIEDDKRLRDDQADVIELFNVRPGFSALAALKLMSRSFLIV